MKTVVLLGISALFMLAAITTLALWLAALAVSVVSSVVLVGLKALFAVAVATLLLLAFRVLLIIK